MEETRATFDIDVNRSKEIKFANISYDRGSYNFFIHDPSEDKCEMLNLTPEIARELAKALLVSADFAEKMGFDT